MEMLLRGCYVIITRSLRYIAIFVDCKGLHQFANQLRERVNSGRSCGDGRRDMTADGAVGSGRHDQPVTLKDVARAAGVHISTVSRVLRQQEPVHGWTDTALRVREVAARLGYRPNSLASGLRTNRSHSIGLLMPRLTDTVIATICESIEDAARYAGYQTLLTAPPDTMNSQMESLDFLLSRQVEGVIATSLHRDDSLFLDRLSRLPIPFITANRHIDPCIPAVVSDDFDGGRKATEYLISLGHTRIGIVAGPRHASTGYDRLQGYRQALESAGIPADESLVIHSEWEVQGGVLGAHALLSLADPPTAIFAVNDTAAIGVMGAAHQRGLSIPRDLSLIGYNDIPIVAQLPIPLTTVRSDLTLMGSTAVHELISAIEGGQLHSVTLPVSLIVRSSTAERH